MPRIIRKDPQTHAVIVDTNILWHEDKKNIVNPEFDNFWKEQCSNFNLKLYVPEVVKGELLFQQATSAIKAKRKIDDCMDKVNQITEKRYSHRITDDEIKSRVELRFNKWLKSANGKIISTPLKRIKWKSLVHASIWRKPPFEYDEKNKDNEKGFRDAVILETIVDFCAKETGNVNIVFICDDGLLKETSDERLSQDSRFSSYEKTEELGSYLKLTQEKLTNQFIKSILFKASGKFFKVDDPNCLYYQSSIQKTLVDDYKKYFKDPTLSEQPQIGISSNFGDLLSKSSDWSETTSQGFFVNRSQFKVLEGDNIYHWVNIVNYVRLYERDFSSSFGLQTWAQKQETKKEEKILILPFHVSWKAKVIRDARFFELEIEQVELKDNDFRILTEEDLKSYKLKKLRER